MIARIAFPILTLWTTLAIVASMANAAPVPDSFANYDYNKEVYALLNTDTEATRSKAKLEAKLEAARANDPGRKALKYVEDKFKAGALLNDIKAFTFDAYKAVVKDNLVDKAAFYKIVTRQYVSQILLPKASSFLPKIADSTRAPSPLSWPFSRGSAIHLRNFLLLKKPT